MLKVENLSYSFPQKELYQNISFTLEEGVHCAFIGTNGTGKSTLIQIIRNPENYLFDGKLEMDSQYRIGYVSQFTKPEQQEGTTVFEYISAPFVEQQKKIDDICTKMETGENMDALLEEYQEEWDLFNAMDGDHYDVNIKKQLKIAGLTKLEHLEMTKLSGGEQKLVQIIREMITLPGLLIMDEPDVFLDFENLNALKALINSHKGTMLVVTHNRYLLNHCFNKILHLENTELQEFDGNYMEYHFLMLQTKIEQMELAQTDMEEIERNRKLVERLRNEATAVISASRGKTLHARVSLLERLEARKTKSPFVEVPHPDIILHTDLVNSQEESQEEKEDWILKVEDLGISFEDQLLEHVSFTLGVKDKVAIVGGNGTGKTTLLREIYRRIQPSIVLSEDANVAYLSQMQGETLEEEKTVLDVMYETGFETDQQIKDYLKPYGFSEEMQRQKVQDLSGGEKNLLQLAVLSRGNANLLLLDEPTSHLDIYAQESLEDAVNAYNGAVLMVSHDFYTIANCVDYVLYVEDKTIRRVSGRKFRKMVYANHFDKDYLEKEQKKKEMEGKIYQALNKNDYQTAKELSEELEKVIASFYMESTLR